MFTKRKSRPSLETAKLSSLIAEDVVITGDVQFARGIRIDGRVKGDLSGRPAGGEAAGLLVLSDKGQIEGTVSCGDAVINGTVIGDLNIERFLEVQANARVIGSIRYGQLQMDVGATVRGQVFNTEAAPAEDNVVELALEAAGRK
jgi:cytoskeletal protein CcmA (bactofilin family)